MLPKVKVTDSELAIFVLFVRKILNINLIWNTVTPLKDCHVIPSSTNDKVVVMRKSDFTDMCSMSNIGSICLLKSKCWPTEKLDLKQVQSQSRDC